jgi:hypothetical protein
MQKYSHNSRRVQKELGGDVYALSGRVDTISDEIDANKDQLIFRVQMVPEDIGTTGTLFNYLISDKLNDAIAEHLRQFDTVVISGNNVNNPIKGEYSIVGNNNYQWRQTDLLTQKSIVTYNKTIATAKTHTLKADLTTGVVAYDSGTNIDLSATDSYMDFKFYKKGVLS